MKTRKTSIELMRFFGAVMVVLIHSRSLIYRDSIFAQIAYPVVEFFFIISGYFAMKDADKGVLEANDSVKYVWRKAKDLFGLYLFALIITFVIRTALKDSFSFAETMKELFHFKWEFFMLHMLGFNHAPAFNVDYLLAPGWFVSSLMIALVPFYYLARRFGKTFSGVIAPISMTLIYCFIIQSYGTINAGNEVAFGMIMAGNLRAFAGLSTGAFLFWVNGHLKESLVEGKGLRFLQIMDVVSWIFAVSLFVFPKDVLPKADMIFWLVPFSFLLLNGLNDIGPISGFLNHHGSNLWGWLGKLSMYIFLLHMSVVLIWQKIVPVENPVLGSLCILAIVLVFSTVTMLVRERIRH